MAKGATTKFIRSRRAMRKNQARARKKRVGKYHPEYRKEIIRIQKRRVRG